MCVRVYCCEAASFSISHIDHVITDPPYSAHVHSHAISNNYGIVGHDGVSQREFGFGHLTDDLRSTIARFIGQAASWSAVFSDVESCHIWRDSVKCVKYIRSIPWVRWSQPQLTGDRPPTGCEMITLWHSTKNMSWNGPGSLTMYDAKSLRGRNKFSTEKPLDLMLSLVSQFTNSGDLILDPCAGSGTTGLACKLLGRRAILLECNKNTYTLACDRIYSTLSDRDYDRCNRWVDSQAWCYSTAPDTSAGEIRYGRARVDTELVRSWLK